MPRDSSGNYSLPSGNPVVSGEVIATSWANPTMSDIASEMTNSLDRNGRGGMLAPFKFLDGTDNAPGITWSSEPTSGIYRAGAQDMRITIAGIPTFRFTGASTDVWDAVNDVWVPLVTTAGGINFIQAGAGGEVGGDLIIDGDVTVLNELTVEGPSSFEDIITLNSIIPMIVWNETGAPVDNRRWRMYALGEKLILDTQADDELSNNTVFFVDRTGIVVDSIKFPTNVVVGNDTVDGYLTIALGTGGVVANDIMVKRTTAGGTAVGTNPFIQMFNSTDAKGGGLQQHITGGLVEWDYSDGVWTIVGVHSKTYGVLARDKETGTIWAVGYKNIPNSSVWNSNTVQNVARSGTIARYTGSGGNTWTTYSASADGETVTLINNGTGTFTIVCGGTLRWFTGSAATDGSPRTVAIGGVVTLVAFQEGANNWMVFGSGIS